MRFLRSASWHACLARSLVVLISILCLTATSAAMPRAAAPAELDVALEVLSVTPAPNALAVARNTQIVISFSEDVDPETLDE